MIVVVTTVVGLATVLGGFQFGGEFLCPFFPSEVSLFREFYRENEGLGLPGLSEDGTACVASKARKVRIRRIQGSRPIGRGARKSSGRPRVPTVRARESGLNIDADVFRPCPPHWNLDMNKRHDRE